MAFKDLENMLGALRTRIGNVAGSPFSGDFRLNSFSPFRGGGLSGASPFSANLSSQSPFAGKVLGAPSPFAGRTLGAPSPFNHGIPGVGRGNIFGNPLAGIPIQNPYAPKAPLPGQGGSAAGGGTFTGTGTADENKALTAQQIDAWIAATRPNSPLVGMGGYMLQEANRQGISVPHLLGIMLLESGLGTEQGTLPGVYNYGGLTGTGWEGQTGNTTGMARAFATFDSKEHGIKALIANLASPLYKGKSIAAQTSLWYLGREGAGPGETDEAGNASVQQYLDTIGSVYRGLGVTSYNPNATPTRAAGGGEAGNLVANDGEYFFPVVGYSGPVQLHHGSEKGATDIMAPRGSAIVAMHAGTVTYVGNDSIGGYNVMIQGTDGRQYYYAHMDQQPLVAQGMVVRGGTRLGVVGDSGNAKGTGTHLHIGVGTHIINGVGPEGGAGDDFDLVGFLNGLQGRRR